MNSLPAKKTAWATLLGAALVAGTSSGIAQTFITDSYTNSFDSGANTQPFSGSGSVASWIYWYNSPGGNTPMTNDVTMDANNNATSGSLEVVSPLAGYTQNVYFGTFGNQYGYDFSTRMNMLLFTNITFDIRVAAGTPPDANGNFGTLGVGIINSSYGYQEFGRPTIPGAASNGWVHISVDIDHTQNNLNDVPGIAFDYNSYSGYPLFTVTNWIDNLQVHLTPGPPPPPPTVGLETLVPGLSQFADSQPSYNRQSVRTDPTQTSDLQWYGKSKPVSYSWTVADYPVASGFQLGFTLTPDPISSQIYSDPDWSATNALWVNINALGDGRVRAGIAYKTNQAAGNSQLFTAPTQMIPGNTTNGLTVPSGAGTWTLTFTSDTDMTLTAPNGAVTNCSLPADVAALFNAPLGVFLYSAPTADANIGKHLTFSGYHTTGTGTIINEDFTSGTLSSPALVLNSQNYFYTGNYTNHPPNQIFATANDLLWMNWTKPDPGFTPVVRTNIAAGSWNDLPGASLFSSGGKRYTKVSKSATAYPAPTFFALVQRQFSQLQVLLPGETNAPGTTTGKVGTPTPVNAGDLVTVTVNAVDSAWHIVNVSGDTIHITTTDGTAFTPNDASLSNGSMTGVIQFNSSGSWTVTASDVTDPSKTSNTSSTLTVQ